MKRHSDLEVQLYQGSRLVWLAVVSDRELEEYLEKRSGSQVVLLS